MLLISGLVCSEKIILLTLLPNTFKSAPLSTAAISGPPPKDEMSTSPATVT